MTATHPPAAAGVSAPDVRPRRLTLERASLLLLLALTAVAYLWTLSESGYANDFYAAAAQAGSKSWKAWFFGSLDAGNAITVDKPPASLWVMGLSVRIFGLSSWSILVPQALMGVATVGLTFSFVRRVTTWQAGIVAGALAALTPAAVLMFRFDNPDALLLLLLVGAGLTALIATQRGSWRWLVAAGVLVGLAFLTKMLQGFLIVPVLGLVYLVAAPVSIRRRFTHLLAAALAMIVSAGWWVAVVQLWPASSRPYIDGSTKNSVLELVFGYNGFGRLTGDENGGLGNFGSSSAAGPLRIFEGTSGGMVAWLAPAAVVVLVAGIVALWRTPRTDVRRAGLVIAGGSALITAAVFSSMHGIYHDYYTVALAPWIAMTAVIGFAVLWPMRSTLGWRVVLAVAVLATAGWAFVLLGQSGEQPYTTLRWIVLVLGILAAGVLVAVDRLTPRLAAASLVAAAVVAGLGPAAYALQTIGTPHTGSIVTAGPYSSGFGPGGGPGGGRRGFPGGNGQTGRGPGGFPGFGQNQNGGTTNQAGLPGQGGFPGMGGSQKGGQTGFPGFGGPGRGSSQGNRGGSHGGFGAMMGGESVSSKVTAALKDNAGEYRWVAVTTSSTSAASYELASGESVMAIGGFNGTAPSITLEQFKAYVEAGDMHYYIAGGGGPGGMRGTGAMAELAEQFAQRSGQQRGFPGFPGFPGGNAQNGRGGFPGFPGGNAHGSEGTPGGFGGPGGRNNADTDASKIASWVEKTFTQVTIDGSTFYDLTKPVTSTNSTITSQNGTSS